MKDEGGWPRSGHGALHPSPFMLHPWFAKAFCEQKFRERNRPRSAAPQRNGTAYPRPPGIDADCTRNSHRPRILLRSPTVASRTKENAKLTTKKLLPKRVVDYIHEMGVRALDHLADNVPPPAPAAAPTEGEGQSAEGSAPDAVATLVSHWRAMARCATAEVVDRSAAPVIPSHAATAALSGRPKPGQPPSK